MISLFYCDLNVTTLNFTKTDYLHMLCKCMYVRWWACLCCIFEIIWEIFQSIEALAVEEIFCFGKLAKWTVSVRLKEALSLEIVWTRLLITWIWYWHMSWWWIARLVTWHWISRWVASWLTTIWSTRYTSITAVLCCFSVTSTWLSR